VFHGTNAPFESFDKDKLGSKNFMAESASEGFFFAGDKKTSEAYIGINSGDVMGLNIQGSKHLEDVNNKFKKEQDVIDKEKDKIRMEEKAISDEQFDKVYNVLYDKVTEEQKQKLKYIDNEWVKWQDRAAARMEENGLVEKQKELNQRKLDALEELHFKDKGLSRRIVSAHLDMKNPYIFDFNGEEGTTEGLTSHIKKAKKAGHDGVIFKNLADGGEKDTIYVVFKPDQIKITNKNILESKSESLLPKEETTEAGNKPLTSEPEGKTFPLPKKPVDEMTAAELDKHIEKVKKYQKETRLTKEQKDALTPEQADEYYGKNLPKEGVYDPTELQRIRNRVQLIEEAETIDDIAATVKRPLIDYARKKDTENLAVIKAAKRQADKLGIPTEEFIQSINNRLKAEFKDDAADISKEIFKAIETKNETTNGNNTQKSIENNELQQAEEGGGGKKPPVDEVNEKAGESDDFHKLVHKDIESDIVKNTLSNIERETGRVLTKEEKEFGEIKFTDALSHGTDVVENAKKEFGEDYIPKLLEYLDKNKNTLSADKKSLIQISMELDLERQIQAKPDNVLTLEKQLKLVRDKSIAEQRSAARAVGYGRLRQIARTGYDISKVTKGFFSTKENEQRAAVEKLMQADAETIQKQYEENVQNSDAPDMALEAKIKEGVEKEINKIYEQLPKDKKRAVDKAIEALEKFQKTLRGKAYDATAGIPVAIIDAGVTTIKLALKAGVKISDAIELGIKKIREKYGKEWDKEDIFRKDMAAAFKLEEKSINPKEFTKNALIQQGFGKEITVTVNKENADGKIEKVKEKRNVLDWTKLAGEERSIDKISANVAKALSTLSMSDKEIQEMSKGFIEEYNRVSQDVIEKGLNAIAKANNTTVTPDQKSAAKKLAEMYNYGLFDKNLVDYETGLAKTVGVSKLNPQRLKNVIELGKLTAELYSSEFQGKKLTTPQLRSAIQKVDEKMRSYLHSEWNDYESTQLMVTEKVKTWMDLSQRMGLVSMGQAIQNPLSGKMESIFSGIAYSGANTGALNRQARKLGNNIYKEIVVEKGAGYGNVQSQFITKGNIETRIDNMSDSKILQGIMTSIIGKPILDAPDSAFKMKATQQRFSASLINILQRDRMIGGKVHKGMSKIEARNYVAEKIAGQSLEDAKVTAKEIIDKINTSAGSKIFNDSPLFIDRLASDIVNAALINGGEVTADMVDSVYNASYNSAGRGLGHVANNQFSAMIGAKSGKYEELINRAKKEKNYRLATTLTAESMLFRNILNPYVGGGTNWVVLSKFEKSGIGLLSAVGSMWKRGGERIDLTSETGLKNLESAMYSHQVIRDKLVRGAVGAIATGLSLALINTDEYVKWSKKHPKWSTITDLAMTEATLLKIAKAKGTSMLHYVKSAFNKNDTFDKPAQAIKAIASVLSGDEKAPVKVGGVVGSLFGMPTPWRIIRDADQLLVEAQGGTAYKVDTRQSETAIQAALKGGMIDWMGLAPKPNYPNAFDKATLSTPSFKILTDNGVKIPETPENKKDMVSVDDEHPEGRMTEPEYTKFVEEWQKGVKEGVDELHKSGRLISVEEIDKYGTTTSLTNTKRIKGDDLFSEKYKESTKAQIKSIISEATEKAKAAAVKQNKTIIHSKK
jgi:hypothetical protein